MSIKNKISVGVAASAIFVLATASAAFADTSVDVAGNGAFSSNRANVSSNCSTDVSQNNTADISNNVNSSANTGGNHANFNTGGSVTIYTGNTSSDVNVSNTAGSNTANIGGMGCGNGYGGADISLTGNGAFSSNNASVTNWTRESWKQYNENLFRNEIYNNLKTGNNTADFNTGTDVIIQSGDANSTTNVNNTAGSNTLN